MTNDNIKPPRYEIMLPKTFLLKRWQEEQGEVPSWTKIHCCLPSGGHLLSLQNKFKFLLSKASLINNLNSLVVYSASEQRSTDRKTDISVLHYPYFGRKKDLYSVSNQLPGSYNFLHVLQETLNTTRGIAITETCISHGFK